MNQGEKEFFEDRHYSVGEVAKMWHLSANSIRRMFSKEPGVLVIDQSRAGSRRVYRTLRIPAKVVEKVHRRMSGETKGHNASRNISASPSSVSAQIEG